MPANNIDQHKTLAVLASHTGSWIASYSEGAPGAVRLDRAMDMCSFTKESRCAPCICSCGCMGLPRNVALKQYKHQDAGQMHAQP